MSECRRCADCEDQRHHWMEDESEIVDDLAVWLENLRDWRN